VAIGSTIPFQESERSLHFGEVLITLEKTTQKILNNYGNNLTEPDVKIFQELMKEITKFIYDSNKNGIEDDDLNIYYIGINNTNADDDTKPQNEIYIHLDLIDGEINDANVSNIKCMYQDLKLTKQFFH
jgi:hypothetical protein